MELLNKKYTIELEVLTPLHVGAGSEKDWMKGADFIEDKNKVYLLNQKKLLQKISIEELSGFLVKKDSEGLKRKISGNLQEVSDLVFTKPASTDNDIKSFIKNGLTNKPIVPGSSIKGAIRSILLKEFLNGNKPNIINEQHYFGSSTAGDEFMRFIKISDAEFEKTKLVNTKIFNLQKNNHNISGGWKHSGGKFGKTTNEFKPTGFNTVYEVITPKHKGLLTIALSDKGFQNLVGKGSRLSYSDKDRKEKIVSKGISNELFKIVNKHTKEYIEKQIAFFEKYPADKSNKIVESLEKIKNQIPADNSFCILKMSAGSGFHSITGDWQFDDFSINQIDNQRRNRGKLNGKPSAKSRKIAIDDDNYYLMGFVKLSVLSDEEILKREKERQAEIEAEQKAKANRLAKEKAEKERVEAEKRAKEETARKAEAERLAKEKAEREERERLLKEKEEEEKRRQEANNQMLEKGLPYLESITDYISGKNLINKIKKKAGPIPNDQYIHIEVFVKKFFNKSDKEWKNLKHGKRWKEIKGWVGQETAQQWFNELIKKQ